jgi:hypothetical protein
VLRYKVSCVDSFFAEHIQHTAPTHKKPTTSNERFTTNIDL